MDRHRKIRVSTRLAFASAGALALAGLLAGCAQTDPYQRSGTWRPAGVNDANIAAQVANPADLARGRSDAGGSVRTSTSAVERMWQGPQQARTQGGAQQGSQQGARQGGMEAQR